MVRVVASPKAVLTIVTTPMSPAAVIAPIPPPVATERVRVVIPTTMEIPSIGMMHQVNKHLAAPVMRPAEEPDTSPAESLIGVDALRQFPIGVSRPGSTVVSRAAGCVRVFLLLATATTAQQQKRAAGCDSAIRPDWERSNFLGKKVWHYRLRLPGCVLCAGSGLTPEVFARLAKIERVNLGAGSMR
jgi:hypothetical protein